VSVASVPVRLSPVSGELRDRVLALALAPGQEELVATNAESLEEAEEDPDARPRAILAGEDVVGFLMYDLPDGADEARLYRFMIDAAHQGRGYGKAALARMLDEIRTHDRVRRVSVCYFTTNVDARKLYLATGFQEEGLDEDGEMIAVLPLDTPPAP
jgi:diamine N-acetyltransferase